MTLHGVEVGFSEWLAFVQVPTQYRSEVVGMCGNFDGDPSNDDTGCRLDSGLSDVEIGNSCKMELQ